MSTQDEVEEFAALLRRLKARSGRSYAALARRLNMNASTLHRYCAGDAVPLGFAPVERFAAMCEASPAERVELHRRWVLAVAARQRSRTATDAAPEVAGAGEGPLSDGTAERVSAAESDPSPGPSPEARQIFAEARTGSSREHDAASRPASRKPWHRRRSVVTAAVVTALIATLGGLSALPSGYSWTTGDNRGQASGKATTQTVGARHGSPAPSAPALGEHPSSPSAQSSAHASPTAPPLTWTVDSQLWAIGCMHDYVIDKAPEQVPPPPAPQDAAPWARTQGAVHGGQTLVAISVQGRTDAAVVLEALRVRVVGRAAPVKGTVYSTGQGCGSDMSPRSFAVDLDMDRPIARSVQGSEAGRTIPARRMPYRVSSKDPEVLLVDARTAGCDCRWYLELDWSSQGRTGTERIDDHGLAFRTSGIKGLPRYWYARQGWTLLDS
ncbi:helix-turn-helix transcriptional regulator [Streptomyces sp. MI02-7b]|uniref:helix-turn-helix domain-containing protein n=1 Tax=Streptomyces sp. MI02-7b TaxID=462941 RepID=UPI0029B65334|nr:helix-turn-helix transcriptional regulator [Streptomyces sp. MI02-7b]MDX3077012.1 helix-turn-helix transcriptional regulator [Streptomyces sp. MI02-7b]